MFEIGTVINVLLMFDSGLYDWRRTMNSGKAAALWAWHPATEEDRATVLRELDEVLASPQFSNSKRYPALLRYVVQKTLEGRGDQLKERTLGVEVFGRALTYDTNNDTIVRYTAGEVRKRLVVFYSTRGHLETRIQITLPVGSYVPEFLHPGQEILSTQQSLEEAPHIDAREEAEPTVISQVQMPVLDVDSSSIPLNLAPRSKFSPSGNNRWIFAAVTLVFLLGSIWIYRTARPKKALDRFWAPVLNAQGTPLICSGGVVFAHNGFSGVTTANKDVDYPFVSMQTANSLTRIGTQIQSGGSGYDISSAPSTSLNQLRERPLILVGAYNNQWTLQLLAPLRFHFPAEPAESIIDSQNPQVHWKRDRSVGYANSDDYALIARFQNKTTDGITVALAGLGRNGTEAAAQFVTSPHYMQLLRDRIGKDIDGKNIEVVISIKVIQGKTGAPSIEAVYVW
jgi:hypothetical protein